MAVSPASNQDGLVATLYAAREKTLSSLASWELEPSPAWGRVVGDPGIIDISSAAQGWVRREGFSLGPIYEAESHLFGFQGGRISPYPLIAIGLVAVFLLLLATPAFAKSPVYNRHIVRQVQNGSCNLIQRLDIGNGGRKIGFVIDISTSMEDNDPGDLRLTAARILDESLISANEATDGKTADLVTVVLFAASPRVEYPLGDPEGAVGVFTHKELESGTYAGGGINSSIDELTKPGHDPTPNRTGIIVFTDGLDNSGDKVPGTLSTISRAGSLGIRVSYGFLADSAGGESNPLIQKAVLQTGGTYSIIDKATGQEAFLALLVLQGLTGIDTKGGDTGTTTLLPGLTITSQVPQTGPKIFSYHAISGEKFNITVTAIDSVNLTATLHDAKANTDITTQQTNSTGTAFIEYMADSDMDLEVLVTGNVTGNNTLFTLGLRSSISDCSANTPNATSTATKTPTQTFTPHTGGAVPAAVLSLEGWGTFFTAFFSVLGFTAGAALL